MSKQPSSNEPVRDVVAADGVVWRVREVRDWNSVGKQVKSLLAERAGGFRKLWSYPGNWSELSDVQLGALINDPVPTDPSAKGGSPAPSGAAGAGGSGGSLRN